MLYEQKTTIGYPVSKKTVGKCQEYQYKITSLYGIENNDTLMIYGTGNTPPGAGIIFRKYRK